MPTLQNLIDEVELGLSQVVGRALGRLNDSLESHGLNSPGIDILTGPAMEKISFR